MFSLKLKYRNTLRLNLIPIINPLLIAFINLNINPIVQRNIFLKWGKINLLHLPFL